MNYAETCEYLFNQMPMFERQGASGYKEGLANTLALDEHFGHPHKAYVTIHVGGTNGKGSVSHTIASILQESGYRVGLYTSPHLVDFRERIRVNGTPISERYVVDFVEQEKAFFEPLHPSFFEVTTAMAFYDHTQFLGNTLAEIAAEKAGIIKKGVPVVIGENNDETRPVFEAKAKEMEAPIVFAEDNPEFTSAEPTSEGGMLYHTPCFGDITGDLGGLYQQKNLNTVFFALAEIAKKGFLCACKDEVNKAKCLSELLQGIAHVKDNTGLMGRWQVIQNAPKVVCDTGHNVGGWQYISAQLSNVRCQTMHIVFGMVDDKDVNGVLELLPKDAKYYFTKADSHRAINETTLCELASKHGLAGNAYPSVLEAYNAALNVASHNDFIFVGGSSYVVGDFLKNCV